MSYRPEKLQSLKSNVLVPAVMYQGTNLKCNHSIQPCQRTLTYFGLGLSLSLGAA